MPEDMYNYDDTTEAFPSARTPLNNKPTPNAGQRPSPGGGNLNQPGGPPPPDQGAPPGGGSQAPFMKPQKLPTSQFAQQREVPQIQVDKIEQPDTHINIEFCLEQAARVLEELAEKQEDQTWLESHRTLAEQWLAMAQALMDYRLQAQNNVGEAELKQQQLFHQEDMHQQTMAHQDQQHLQSMKHQNDMHQQSMKQNDAMHSFGLKQKDDVHSFDMKTRTTQADMKIQDQKNRMAQRNQASRSNRPR